MATPQASSRLELLQARFQQKQLQEKEQKLLQLYDQQQQRAYQVVQRGSAGSNGSNHGSSISQHTVTKTATTSHTTSTSHGGKVRQMFDERRQTTVKGIDRSYPLEPLENKPRKQTNGNVVQKNGNLTVNRQSVTVKRVARADVNSNLNGGKPIVSYHEEITRESYGSAGRQQSDDDEFGNENHINQYANGNQTHIEEALDEDTIERNRMMAKLHLMEYDDTLKHRVKNDLESEEFPVDYMVDVPDKLPKRNVTKKLSQAEARLERFKNANAKRSNSVSKNPGTVLKKRSDPILPAKSTSSEDRGKTRIRQIFDRGSSRRASRHIESNVKSVYIENVDERSSSEKNARRKDEDNRVYYKEGEMLMSSDIDKELKTRGRNASPKLFYEESEKLDESYAIDDKYREKLSPGFSKNTQRRSESPHYIYSKITTKSTDQLFLKDKANLSESPKYFCKESEKSATTYAIDSRSREKFSPEFSRNIQKRSDSPDTVEKSQQFSKDIRKRSESPKYFCKESEKSATTYAIDSRTREKLSPEFSRDMKQRESPSTMDKLSALFSKNIRKRSESPKFFCKESEKSATTYAMDSKTRDKLSPEISKNIQRRSDSPETVEKLSPQFSKNIKKRSESPTFFCKESEKSATTYAIDSKTRDKLSPEFSTNVRRRNESPDVIQNLSAQFPKNIEKRSVSPKYFCKESEKSATTYAIDSRTREKLSPDFSKNIKKRSESPKFYCKESEKSATTFAIDSKTAKQLSSKSQMKDIQRSESPKYFCEETEKSATTYAIESRSPDFVKIEAVRGGNVSSRNYPNIETEVDKKSAHKKMPNVFERLTRERSSSPKFAQTSTRIKSTKSPDFTKVSLKRNESPEITKSKSPKFSTKLDRRSSTSPQFFGSDSERSATIMLVTPETILKKKPESKKQYSKTYKADRIIEPKRTMSEEIVDASSKQSIRSSVSRFFSEQCEKASRNLEAGKENDVQSAVTDNRRWSRDSSPLSLKDVRTTSPQFSRKPISATSIDSVRDWSPKSRRNSVSPELSGNKIRPKSTENASKQVFVKQSRSPDFKDANKMADRVTGNVLRSTRLICDAINQNRTYEDDVDKCEAKGRRRTCGVDKDAAGILLPIDSGSKREMEDGTCGKVDERSRTPSCRMFESPAMESSPKSSTSVEVDAEIQEITMSDQYIEHQPREVRSKSRDKTPDCGRSSTEKLFTYSVRKPARKRGSLFESNVVELSKKDQGKIDRRETSGRKEHVSFEYTVKNTRSPSADSLTFRGSKCLAEENEETRTEMENLRIRKEEYDDFKSAKRNWSSSPSPTSELTFRGSTSLTEENEKIRKVEIGGSRLSEIKVDEARKRKSDNVRRTERNWSDSPSPTSDLTFRGYKHPTKESEEINRKTKIGGTRSPEKKVLREYQRQKYDNFKRKERNWSGSPSPTNNMTFRGSKRPFEENEEVDRKIKTGVSRSSEGIILYEYDEEKCDNFQRTQQHLSSSPSPTDSSAFRGSKRELNKNLKVNQEIKVEMLQSRKRVPDKRDEGKRNNFERRQRSWSSSPSPTNTSTVRGTKCVSKSIAKKDKVNFQSRERKTNVNESKKTDRAKYTIRSKSSDPITSKRRVSESCVNRRNEIREKPPNAHKRASSKSPEISEAKEPEILRSMELVRKVIKGGALKQEETIKTAISDEAVGNKETEVKKSDSARTMKIETRKSSSTIVYLNDESSSSKNYERTDSVESALRRFDSIGTESVQSITEKRQTVEESRNDSKAISLKALDQIDANLPQSLTSEQSLKRTTVVSGRTNKNESETRCRRKCAEERDFVEIARIAVGSKSPTCKRKLFPDDEETASSRSRHSSGSTKINEEVSEESESKIGSRCSGEETFVEGDKLGNETREMSTGVSLALSVKRLRSIEDIRKSIDSLETKGTSNESAIANETLKRSKATQSRRLASRRTDVDGSKKETRRSENFSAKKDALGDSERSSIKCAMRFSRVTKSPSPDTTKTTESSSRVRRNVLTSPSKSPDTVTVARRPSTELKAQEARSTKRPTLMKGTEPIGNRKTATTTSTRKSTDVVDGAILENGVHLRDQTAETKYDNDSSATKKSDAFVIDFDEQPPKENDAPVPRKSLLRKHSTDKQIPSTQTGRPPSSVSSISSGNSMQSQIFGSKGKMASKAKTPSGTAHRGSTGSKSGGCAVVADTLVPCKICGRRFAQDRVALHEQICTKTTQKKRKQFDTMMYRVRGTDLEPFVKKGLCKKQPEKSKKSEPKSNWRRKHEDFINAIRSAKQVQAHLAAGGKLSDLPPPPASDTSDYIQCPHCGRKFNKSAADRHIPKCEHMLHNKPVHSRAPKPRR